MGSDLFYDVWVSPDGKEILDRKWFTGKREFESNKWYSSEELQIWLRCRANKWRLDNFDKAHERVFGR